MNVTFRPNGTARPIVGLVDYRQANSLMEAQITTATQLVAGDPIVVLSAQASQSTQGLMGLNPTNRAITAKATTVTGGANSTNICGFMVWSNLGVVNGDGMPLYQQNQIVNYAPIGGGATIWLYVASQNQAGFQTSLDTNTLVTLDTTNGGVKVGSGSDVIVGATLIQGLTQAQRIVESGGSYVLQDCLAVQVKLG